MNVNVCLYKFANLQKFLIDCFEIQGLNCIRMQACYYILIMNLSPSPLFFHMCHQRAIFYLGQNSSCDISLESESTHL